MPKGERLRAIWVQEMIRASFSVVKNKLAESKCGCGSSFSPLVACFLSRFASLVCWQSLSRSFTMILAAQGVASFWASFASKWCANNKIHQYRLESCPVWRLAAWNCWGVAFRRDAQRTYRKPSSKWCEVVVEAICDHTGMGKQAAFWSLKPRDLFYSAPRSAALLRFSFQAFSPPWSADIRCPAPIGLVSQPPKRLLVPGWANGFF